MLRIFGVATQEEFGFPQGAEGGSQEERLRPFASALVDFRDTVRGYAKGCKPPLEPLMVACVA